MLVVSVPWNCADTRQLLPSRPEISSSPIYIPCFLCRSKVNTGERSWLQGELGVWAVSCLCHLVKCWNNVERLIPSPLSAFLTLDTKGKFTEGEDLIGQREIFWHLPSGRATCWLATFCLIGKSPRTGRWPDELWSSWPAPLLAFYWLINDLVHQKQKQTNKTTKLYPITNKIFTLQIALGWSSYG